MLYFVTQVNVFRIDYQIADYFAIGETCWLLYIFLTPFYFVPILAGFGSTSRIKQRILVSGIRWIGFPICWIL